MPKNKNWISTALIVLMILAVGAGMAYFKYHGRLGAGHGQHAGQKQVYYCPMHPNYTSDRPGTCPICNMTLVLREDNGDRDHLTVGAGSEPAPTVNSKANTPPHEFSMKEFLAMKPHEICLLHKCKMGNCMITMTEEIARLGKCPHCGEDLGVIIKDLMPKGYTKVKLPLEKQQLIGVKTSPVVKKPLSTTIRTVGKIAYDPELYQAEEEYLQAIRASEKAQTGAEEELKKQAAQLVDSSLMKLKLLGLSDDLIRDIEKAGKPDRSLLLSEAGGTVWLYAPIYEYEIPLVKINETLEVEVPGQPGKKITGTVRSIDPIVDPMTRSVRIRAVLDNSQKILKPQMYVNVTIKIDFAEVLTVPAEAVFSTGEKNIVFVVKDNQVFEPREVVLGIKTETENEVKSGLGDGELVVTSGNFLIDSESQLKAALDGMSQEHQHG